METHPKLVPLLVVRGAAEAIDFYVRALGAKVLSRFEHGPKRHLSHADLALADAVFSLTEELRAWNSDAPVSLGGSPVVLQLEVSDAEAVLASMSEAGATVVYPLGEFVGERMARVRDPFGHVWILREHVERLSDEEIQRRRDELFARFASAASASTPASAQDVSSLRDGSPALQAPSAVSGTGRPATAGSAGNSGKVHVIVGPVGAGKSTFARRLERERRALRLSLDEWMATLFSPDRPEVGRREWYVERRARCTEQICAVAKAAGDAGAETVLELGLLRRDERERCYAWIEAAGFELTVYVLDAAREVRRERVALRNVVRGETFSMLVPLEFFELASDLWQPLEAVECEGRDVRFMRTDDA
jgi:uncharacterized glyoxalase superfamily protein PhnB/predicted kinase